MSRRLAVLAAVALGALALPAPGAHADCATLRLPDGFAAAGSTCFRVNPQPPTAGIGATVQFTLQAPPTDATAFHYDFGDGQTEDQPDPAVLQTSHSYASRGARNVTVTADTPGGPVTASTTVTVDDPPVASLVEHGPYVGNVTLDAGGSTGGSALTYAFDCENDGTFSTPGPATTFGCRYLTPGAHTAAVRVTDDLNVSTTKTVTFTLQLPPISAALSVSPATIALGGSATFDATGSRATGDTVAMYQWDVDGDGTADGTTTASTMTWPIFPVAGVLHPSVTVIGTFGESAKATTTLTVQPGSGGSGGGSGGSGGSNPGGSKPGGSKPGGSGAAGSGATARRLVVVLSGSPIQRRKGVTAKGMALRVRASGAARGTLTATISARDARKLGLAPKAKKAKRGRKARASKKPVVVGRASVKLVAGKTKALRLKLTKKARKALKRHKRGRVRVLVTGVVRDASGHKVRVVRAVLVR